MKKAILAVVLVILGIVAFFALVSEQADSSPNVIILTKVGSIGVLWVVLEVTRKVWPGIDSLEEDI